LTVIFLAQLFAASEWAKENRDETLEISARGQYGVTVKQLDSVRDADFHKNLAPSFDHNLLELLRSQNKFLFDNGFIDKPVDIDAWIDESYIQKALEL
jgi:sulfonate transport system substrate-binding protein